MKSTNYIIYIFALLLISYTTNGQPTAKTLVKSFNVANQNVIYLDVSPSSKVIINEWSQDQMRVTMTVSLAEGPEMMLKSLVKVGRYNLDSADEDGLFRVFIPGLEREVKLRSGKKLSEIIDFEVFVPSSVTVRTNEEVLAEKSGL